eukprot:1386167-Pyramimonas_sp.AAC.1
MRDELSSPSTQHAARSVFATERKTQHATRNTQARRARQGAGRRERAQSRLTAKIVLLPSYFRAASQK